MEELSTALQGQNFQVFASKLADVYGTWKDLDTEAASAYLEGKGTTVK